MQPYCIYLRKSRADMEAEAHGEGETLARHEKLLLEVARRGPYNVTQIYREVVSGETIAARPVMQQLLQEVEQGLWEGVLVVEVERLARGDTIDQGIMAQTFKYSGTKIVTPLKVYDPNNEYDEEYFEFGLFMSRREYKTINRRLQRGRLASAKEGKWVSGVAPYGYERVRVPNDKGWTLRPVEAEADIVRFIFRLYTSGEEEDGGSVKRAGTYSLALRLDNMGVAPPGGASYWSSTTIQQILQNPVYIGKIRWNVHKSKKRIINSAVRVERYTAPPEEQILVDGLHPAIVDEAVFLAAQDLIAQKGPPPVQSENIVKNPLAGLLVCGKCGRNMTLRPNAYGGMLLCPSRVCDNIGSKYEIVEERLLQALSRWLDDYRLEWSDRLPTEEQALIDLKEKSIRKRCASSFPAPTTYWSRVSTIPTRFSPAPGLSQSVSAPPKRARRLWLPNWWRTRPAPPAGKTSSQRSKSCLRSTPPCPPRRPRTKCSRRLSNGPSMSNSPAPGRMARLTISSWWCSPSSPALSGNEKSRPIPFGRLFFVITLQV